MKWYVLKGVLNAHMAEPGKVLCDKTVKPVLEREWSVFQDVGRIRLCEKCRKKCVRT